MHVSLSRARLTRSVDGAVLDGRDPAAAAAASAFNTAVTHRPSVVVAAAGAADVAAAVRHAAETGDRVAVQGTGHGAAPVDGGVLVTTGRMQGLWVDPVARVARVEAGVRWRRVIDASAPHGLAPLSGSSSGVGVAGYTLGGGMGHLGRRHGFAADHVRAVELVTADGTLRRVTADTDPDLFWAVRGGGGALGVATALELDLVPVPEFVGGALLFGPAAVEPVLRAFARWAPTLPEEAATSVAVLRLPPVDDVPPPLRGVVSLALRFGYAGPATRAEELLRPMRRAATPLLDSVAPMSFAAVDGIHMDPAEPMPSLARGALLHSLHEGPVDALLAVAGPDVQTPLAMVEIRLMGGALGRQPTVPNAVAGREGAFSLLGVAPAPPPLRDAAESATRGVLDALAAWSLDTSLLNFAGPERPAHRVWAPEPLDRLRRTKAAVDPENRFAGLLGADLGRSEVTAVAR